MTDPQIYILLGLEHESLNIPVNSSRWLKVVLLDYQGNPITDTSILNALSGSYTIIDQKTGAVITVPTSFTFTDNEASVLIPNTANIILDGTQNEETHVISVSVDYGVGLQENKEIFVTIDNLWQ